jgi:hypothetical protein
MVQTPVCLFNMQRWAVENKTYVRYPIFPAILNKQTKNTWALIIKKDNLLHFYQNTIGEVNKKQLSRTIATVKVLWRSECIKCRRKLRTIFCRVYSMMGIIKQMFFIQVYLRFHDTEIPPMNSIKWR